MYSHDTFQKQKIVLVRLACPLTHHILQIVLSMDVNPNIQVGETSVANKVIR